MDQMGAHPVGFEVAMPLQLNCELVGPFQVQGGVKVNSEGYCTFLKTNFLPWWKRQSAKVKETLVFMTIHHHMPHTIPKAGWHLRALKTMERVEVSPHELVCSPH